MAAHNESKLANMLFVHELVMRGRTRICRIQA